MTPTDQRQVPGWFERALKLDPSSLEAHAGLFELGSKSKPTDAPPAVALLQRARRLQAAGAYVDLAALDNRLAALPPGSPLFRTASRLRAEWRLAKGGKKPGVEALAIVDGVIVRGTTLQDYLLRTRAAFAAERPEAARAALIYVSQHIAPAAKSIAREALDLASALPPAPGNEALRERLTRIAQ